MPISEVFNIDCMEYMREIPNGFFDLAVVDPPYGDGLGGGNPKRFGGMFRASIDGSPTRGGGGARSPAQQPTERRASSCTDSGSDSTSTNGRRASGLKRWGGHFDRYKRPPEERQQTGLPSGGGWAKRLDPDKKIIAWDVAPGEDYFRELFRVSRNQVIWGGNYFDLPPTRCFCIFRKTNIPAEGFSMAPVEYAWTSFNRNAVLIEAFAQSTPSEKRFHPTQKPIKLYERIFSEFAKPGDKILDTHLGSGSSRIAAWDAGLDFYGCEIDKVYFDQAAERFEAHAAQISLFNMAADQQKIGE